MPRLAIEQRGYDADGLTSCPWTLRNVAIHTGSMSARTHTSNRVHRELIIGAGFGSGVQIRHTDKQTPLRSEMLIFFRRQIIMNLKHPVLCLSLLATFPAFAAPESDVKEKWRTPFGLYLTPQEAYDMKTSSPDTVAFLDVRTRAEVKYIGMADQIDANIPIRFLRTDYAWSLDSSTFRTEPNKQFADAVENLLASMNLTKNDKIIIMCTSGSRAPKAARALHEAGFKQVYTQYQGFEGLKAKSGKNKGKRLVNGWKNDGLPWSYKLKKEKMYFNFTPDNKTKGE